MNLNRTKKRILSSSEVVSRKLKDTTWAYYAVRTRERDGYFVEKQRLRVGSREDLKFKAKWQKFSGPHDFEEAKKITEDWIDYDINRLKHARDRLRLAA